MTEDEELEKFTNERNEALATLDVSYIARMFPEMPTRCFLITMHKARYECTAINGDLRRISAAWLLLRDLQDLS